MATLSLNLDTRTCKNGMSPVRLRIRQNATNCFIPTGVSVEPQFFDAKNLRMPISRKAYMSCEKNEQIASLIRKYDEVIFDLSRSEDIDLDALSANDIRAYIVGDKAPKRKPVTKPTPKGRVDFLDFFDHYGQSKDTENTRRHYAYVYRLLCRYANETNGHHIFLDEIDYLFLCRLRLWVLNGRQDVTRYKVESYMHSAYKEAQRLKLISKDADPYDDYKIRSAEVNDAEIEVIELADLQRFLSLDLTNQQGCEGLSRARDILWASFCMCGANLIDLYHMPKQIGNEVVYIRHKNIKRTKRPVHTRIVDDLDYIIDRYKGEQYMFNFQERHANYFTFQRRINNRCERLSKLLGAKVNMQLIRHTWATIAGMEAVDWHIVDKSLGHKDTTVTDKHYQRFIWDKAAEANSRVIEAVLRGVTPNSVKVPAIFRTNATA